MDAPSVTTAMEMDIDIGSLLSVGLRNVAPTVATYAQDASHSQYCFHRSKEIVSDLPRAPALHLDNDVIARRHMRSLVLGAFFLTRRARGVIIQPVRRLGNGGWLRARRAGAMKAPSR